MEGECVYSMAAFHGFCSASARSAAKTEPFSFNERVNRSEGVEFNRSTFLTDSFVDAGIIAQIGAGKFLFERILEVVGVAKEFMAVEHSDVGHSEHSAWSESVAVMLTQVKFESSAMTCQAQVVVLSSAS